MYAIEMYASLNEQLGKKQPPSTKNVYSDTSVTLTEHTQ